MSSNHCELCHLVDQLVDLLESYLAERVTRADVARTVGALHRDSNPALFEGSDSGQLVEYTLLILSDDDWLTDSEHQSDARDLLVRLLKTREGKVALP